MRRFRYFLGVALVLALGSVSVLAPTTVEAVPNLGDCYSLYDTYEWASTMLAECLKPYHAQRVPPATAYAYCHTWVQILDSAWGQYQECLEAVVDGLGN